MDRVSILNEYYKHREDRRNKMPKKKGFYIERNPFRFEWDTEEESNG